MWKCLWKRKLRFQHWQTTPYSCQGIFTDRSIFRLNLFRIQIPTGSSVTNCNHKQWPMLTCTCRHVHVRLHCFILTEACSCRLELAYFTRKICKNRLVCKNAVAFGYYGSCRLLVMYSWCWPSSFCVLWTGMEAKSINSGTKRWNFIGAVSPKQAR